MKTMKTLLREMRKLLTKPHAWTTKALARTKTGLEINPNNKFAVCWCLLGAIHKIAQTQIELYNLEAVLTENLPSDYSNIIKMNDTTSHKEVLNFIDRVILSEK